MARTTTSRRPRRVAGKRRPARRGRRMARRTKVSANVKRFVKKEISKNIENKYVTIYADGNQHNSAIGAQECYPLVPPVIEGTGSDNRVGKTVRPTGLYVKGQIFTSPEYNDFKLANQSYYKPIQARVIIFKQKNINSCYNIGNVRLDTLLRPNFSAVNGTPATAPTGYSANDSSYAFTGRNYDQLVPINKENFEVAMDRKFIFTPNLMEPLSMVSGGSEPGFVQQPINTNFFEYSIKLPVNKVLKFAEDSTSTWPVGTAWWVAVGYSYLDGTGADVVGTQVTHQALSTMYFEDA